MKAKTTKKPEDLTAPKFDPYVKGTRLFLINPPAFMMGQRQINATLAELGKHPIR